jgi:hypothetical protein
MDVQAKRFNWFRSPSVWEYAEFWRARRKAAIEEFLAALESSRAVPASTQTDFFPGMGTNTAREVIDRAQQERAAAHDSGSRYVDRLA